MSCVKNQRKRLARREFIKRATQVTAVSTALGGSVSAAAPAGKEIQLADTIPTRVLGKTGVKLPILGLGGAALIKGSGNPLSEEDRVELVRYACDCR